jgi:hypothetical protein
LIKKRLFLIINGVHDDDDDDHDGGVVTMVVVDNKRKEEAHIDLGLDQSLTWVVVDRTH